MSTPFLSLIFVNYQSVTLLQQAIASWKLPLKSFSYEIIVINNDITEDAAITRLAASEGITIRNVGHNVGFGKANNIGASLAQGEWLFLLNPDTAYEAGSLEGLLPVFEAYPRSLGGVRLLTYTGTEEPWSGGAFPTLWSLVKNHLRGASSGAIWQTPVFSETDWVSGAALIISQRAFQELQGFDEAFFLYFEDVDLAKRAKSVGMSVWRMPTLTVRHKGGASQANHTTQKQSYYASEERYFKKHRSQIELKLFTFLQRLLFS